MIIIRNILAQHAVVIGLCIRIFLAWFLPWLLDNERFIPGVAYTDIDFHVFSDGASYIRNGSSPYNRTTYRYTPFLALLLSKLPNRESGRYLFCIADTICGWIILQYRQRQRQRQRYQQQQSLQNDNNDKKHHKQTDIILFQDALWWLYNPLAINICTRGSAESLLVLLPVLITVWIVTSFQPKWYTAIVAGICHGIAMHAKLYPIIYTLAFMTTFCSSTPSTPSTTNASKESPQTNGLKFLCSYLLSWLRCLLHPNPFLFGFTSVLVFCGLTYLAVIYYGKIALDEGLLYHFSRVDHRHNYSMHWYWIYLARASNASMAWVGRLLLVPQLVLLFAVSLGIAPNNIALALFVQTFLFVAHNKVITAQYFTWYLCLLPLCSDKIEWKSKRIYTAVSILVSSILLWLGSAYCLEMQGMAVHRIVWIASVLFFLANTNLLSAILASQRQKAKLE